MSLVVVGGHTRSIGKTSVAAGIIAALPALNWTAVKVTQYGHGVCSADGEPCDCAPGGDHPYALSEETGSSDTDSGRFLEAGARRSFWLRTPQGRLGDAIAVLRRLIEESENTILESNSAMQYFRPDLYVVVVDFSADDFKPSALRYLDRADCIVASGSAERVIWKGVARRLWDSKPRFPAAPEGYVSEDLRRFVRERLAARVQAGGSRIS
jgi:hypothetical protein